MTASMFAVGAVEAGVDAHRGAKVDSRIDAIWAAGHEVNESCSCLRAL